MSFQTGTKLFWDSVLKKIESGINCTLLVVTESDGSSPGREGFKMLVSTDGSLLGSIGGGALEHNLVEIAREKLKTNSMEIICKRYFHTDKGVVNKSGMICSGSQAVALIPLVLRDTEVIRAVYESTDKNREGVLNLSHTGMNSITGVSSVKEFDFTFVSENDWSFSERIGYLNSLHIIGGGHCSLALSKIMSELNFHITVYDDRQEVETMRINTYANEKKYVPFTELESLLKNGERVYAVIMTFGHKADELVLKQLIRKKLKYTGMMGSPSKVKQIFDNLLSEGFTKDELSKIHAPIGVQINSKTPEEIAISIAAQIIKIKNS
jgi:xanthine dehydrogenase accessory factor